MAVEQPNHAAVPHHVLHAMVGAADGPATAELAQAWQRLGASLDQAAAVLRRAESACTADQLRLRIGQLAGWTATTGQRFAATARMIGQQGDAAVAAAQAMPVPAPYQPAESIRDALSSGDLLRIAALPFALPERRELAAAAHRTAVEVAARRDERYAAAAVGAPSVVPPPSMADLVTPVRPPVPRPPVPPPTYSPTYPPAFAPAGGFGPGGSGPFDAGASRSPVTLGAEPAVELPTVKEVEYKRPDYLVEGDPEGWFTSDELTAPPVIGG